MPAAAQVTFNVTLNRGGKQFTVNRDEMILDAALRQEIWLPHACRGGTCGSCRAIVVAGAVAYGGAPPALPRQGGGSPVDAQAAALLCCAKPLGDLILDIAELPARPLAAVYRRPARVLDIVKPSDDVAVVTLQLPPTAAIRFRPGQYVCLIGDDGRRHPFSIANAPRADGTLELHVGLIPNGRLTGRVHARMAPRDVVRLEGPFGEFGLSDDGARPAILLAGGTGIAPLRAMLEAAAQTGAMRALHLYWGSRRPQGLYAIKDIEGIAVAAGARVTTVVSEPVATAEWSGRRGLVHRAVIEDFPDLSPFEVYSCGNPGLIDAAFADFTRLAGLPAARFFADTFHHAGTVPHVASAAG
jgi:CDP-4-dehydro-6-deoxyglucose reductase